MNGTLHETTNAVMKSNKWDYPFALGYVSGRDDAEHDRKPEHTGADLDDYAKGYCYGFTSGHELRRLKSERADLQAKLDRAAKVYHIPSSML